MQLSLNLIFQSSGLLHDHYLYYYLSLFVIIITVRKMNHHQYQININTKGQKKYQQNAKNINKKKEVEHILIKISFLKL